MLFCIPFSLDYYPHRLEVWRRQDPLKNHCQTIFCHCDWSCGLCSQSFVWILRDWSKSGHSQSLDSQLACWVRFTVATCDLLISLARDPSSTCSVWCCLSAFRICTSFCETRLLNFVSLLLQRANYCFGLISMFDFCQPLSTNSWFWAASQVKLSMSFSLKDSVSWCLSIGPFYLWFWG